MVEIKYCTKQGSGKMNIDVEKFMNGQTIPKIKKLLNLIRQSYDPDKGAVFTEYCEKFLSEFKDNQESLKNDIHLNEQKVERNERLVAECTIVRNRYKRKSEGWEYHHKNLEGFRKELSAAKLQLRTSKNTLNQNERMKVKCEKVLEFISQR